jgi:hypothetical protein
MEPLSQLDRELDLLRRSVTRQDFAAVESAARRCAEILRAGLSSLSAEEAEARLRDLLHRLEAARRSVLVSRVRMAEQLAQLRPRASYGEHPQSLHTFRMDG